MTSIVERVEEKLMKTLIDRINHTEQEMVKIQSELSEIKQGIQKIEQSTNARIKKNNSRLPLLYMTPIQTLHQRVLRSSRPYLLWYRDQCLISKVRHQNDKKINETSNDQMSGHPKVSLIMSLQLTSPYDDPNPTLWHHSVLSLSFILILILQSHL